jgi:hypothetical protein
MRIYIGNMVVLNKFGGGIIYILDMFFGILIYVGDNLFFKSFFFQFSQAKGQWFSWLNMETSTPQTLQKE